MLITIFTPTYNRADLLPRAYESLCKQTCMSKDCALNEDSGIAISHSQKPIYEWVIVDDGSKDNTREVVLSWLEVESLKLNDVEIEGCSKDAPWLKIHYIYKENGGKHTAINRGVKEAKGELFFILDSDDSLPEEAIADIIEEYKDVAGDVTIGGVSGLMAHHDGEKIGSGYPDECVIASSLELRYKYGVTGDLMEVFKTSVLREFAFPEIEGERFCPEDLVWNRIAQKYKLKCFNKVVCYRDYQDGGLTDNIVKIRMRSPIASTTYYSELIRLDIPFKQKIKGAINFWRFWYCLKGVKVEQISWKWWFAKPLGFLMHRRDCKGVRF